MKAYKTMVVMPDNSRVEVHYYCKNDKTNAKDQQAQLFIQLDDCVCTLNIEKRICTQLHELEKIVHNKVINTRGHLC